MFGRSLKYTDTSPFPDAPNSGAICGSFAPPGRRGVCPPRGLSSYLRWLSPRGVSRKSMVRGLGAPRHTKVPTLTQRARLGRGTPLFQ
jgi:hypothetical protein